VDIFLAVGTNLRVRPFLKISSSCNRDDDSDEKEMARSIKLYLHTDNSKK